MFNFKSKDAEKKNLIYKNPTKSQKMESQKMEQAMEQSKERSASFSPDYAPTDDVDYFKDWIDEAESDTAQAEESAMSGRIDTGEIISKEQFHGLICGSTAFASSIHGWKFYVHDENGAEDMAVSYELHDFLLNYAPTWLAPESEFLQRIAVIGMFAFKKFQMFSMEAMERRASRAKFNDDSDSAKETTQPQSTPVKEGEPNSAQASALIG